MLLPVPEIRHIKFGALLAAVSSILPPSGMLRSVWLLACMTPGDTAGPSAARIENASAQILSDHVVRQGKHTHTHLVIHL
jgi:hypothetical protein